MKKTRRSSRRSRPRSGTDPDPAAEYRFDYSRSKPNRFAATLPSDTVFIALDPDVARVYRSSRQVNSALRARIAEKKKRSPRRAG